MQSRLGSDLDYKIRLNNVFLFLSLGSPDLILDIPSLSDSIHLDDVSLSRLQCAGKSLADIPASIGELCCTCRVGLLLFY